MNFSFALSLLILTFSLLPTQGIASSANKSCKAVMATKVHQWAGSKLIANFRESRNTSSKHNYVLEIFKSDELHEHMFNENISLIPKLRIKLQEESILDVEFSHEGEYVTITRNDRVELYTTSKKFSTLMFTTSIPAKKVRYTYTHNSKLFVVTDKAVLIAGKNQSLIKIPFHDSFNLKKLFLGENRIEGIGIRVEEDITLFVDYLKSNGNGTSSREIAFYYRKNSDYISKPVNEIIDVIKDRVTLESTVREEYKDVEFESVSLKLPIINTESKKYSTRHHTFLSHSEFKVEVMMSGYIPIIENIIAGKYLRPKQP